MQSFFQDEFMYKKLLKRMKQEVLKEQLNKTIDEIDYLNELQRHVAERNDFISSHIEEIDYIKKINNVGRKNIQI